MIATLALSMERPESIETEKLISESKVATEEAFPVDAGAGYSESSPLVGDAAENNASDLLSKEAPSRIAQADVRQGIFPASDDRADEASCLTKEAQEEASVSRFDRLWTFLKRLFVSWGKVLRDTWWPEALSLCFSSLCLAAIIIVLSIFNQNPLPHLPSGIALNAVIAVLAAASKSSLMFAVSATMAQCKWCWFQSARSLRRRLHDLQHMEDASRGPLGSVGVLFTHLGLSLCAIGAVIVVFGVIY